LGCLAPASESRRLKNESWSEDSDRIDGWWNQKSTAGFTVRALVGMRKEFGLRKEEEGEAGGTPFQQWIDRFRRR
jgi:hypothetical protein